MIAGLTQGALIAPWVFKGAMYDLAFAAYIHEVLVPEIKPGTVVVLDNLAIHRTSVLEVESSPPKGRSQNVHRRL